MKSQKLLSRIKVLYENGFTMREIGRHVNLSAQMVSTYVRYLGIPTRKSGPRSNLGDNEKQILLMAKQKIPMKEIRKQFKIGHKTLQIFLQKHQLDKPKEKK